MIRRTFFTAAFAAVSGMGVVPAANAMDGEEIRAACSNWQKLAELIMEGRQAGLPMSKAMDVPSGETSKDLVVEAYDRPRFQTESIRKRSIQDFGNDTYLKCYRTLSK